MAVRFYLVPAETTAEGLRPAHADAFAGRNYQVMDFGICTPEAAQPGRWVGYLLAVDILPAQHAALAAFTDVSAMPQNLDNTLGGARQAVEDALESRDLPGQWVGVNMTYRQVLRVVVGACLVAQRFNVVGGGRLFPAGVTLNTAYADMPEPFRTNLLAAIDQLGYDRSMLTAQSTMRDLLRVIGTQAAPVDFLGTVV